MDDEELGFVGEVTGDMGDTGSAMVSVTQIRMVLGGIEGGDGQHDETRFVLNK